MSSFKLRKIIIEIIKKFPDFYIDFAIFDEAHHAVGETYQKLIFSQPIPIHGRAKPLT